MRSPRALALALVSGVAAALLVGSALTAEPARMVVVDERGGSSVARLLLGKDGRFSLRYRHSIYREPALETFEARADDGFRLVELSSPSGAVLDYYGVEGERTTHDGGWLVLQPERVQTYEQLPLIATKTGRRTLVVGERRLPLFVRSGARHVVICVRGDRAEGCD